VIILASCHWPGSRYGKLKFNPVPNKIYHFSLTKYSLQTWTYQSVPYKIYDTVLLNFSLQNIHKTDSTDTCKLAWNVLNGWGNLK